MLESPATGNRNPKERDPTTWLNRLLAHMDRRSITRIPITAFKVLVLLSCVLLVTSEQEFYRKECEPEEVIRCYGDYRDILWRSIEQPDGGENAKKEDIGKRCSELKAKVECHRSIAGCPEELRRNFSRQESGYEALRDLLCDENAARDYYTALSCQDIDRLEPCREKHMKGVTPQNTKDPTCKLSQMSTECYETAFKSDCRLSLKSAKAALSRGKDAVVLLSDCNGSARSFWAPGQLLVAAAALVLLRWASFSRL